MPYIKVEEIFRELIKIFLFDFEFWLFGIQRIIFTEDFRTFVLSHGAYFPVFTIYLELPLFMSKYQHLSVYSV